MIPRLSQDFYKACRTENVTLAYFILIAFGGSICLLPLKARLSVVTHVL